MQARSKPAALEKINEQHEDKLFNIFEPDTQLYRRGKARQRPVGDGLRG